MRACAGSSTVSFRQALALWQRLPGLVVHGKHHVPLASSPGGGVAAGAEWREDGVALREGAAQGVGGVMASSGDQAARKQTAGRQAVRRDRKFSAGVR
jgi:hypothetical protein